MNNDEVELLGALARLRGLLDRTLQKNEELERQKSVTIFSPSPAPSLHSLGHRKINLNKDAFKLEQVSREYRDSQEYVTELTQSLVDKELELKETLSRADEQAKAFREREKEMQSTIDRLRQIEIAYTLQHAEINNTLELVAQTRKATKEMHGKMEALAEEGRRSALSSDEQNDEMKTLKKTLESSRAMCNELTKRLELAETIRLATASELMQEKAKSSRYKQQLAVVEKTAQDRLQDVSGLKEHAAKSHAARHKAESELKAAQATNRALQQAFEDLSQTHERALKDKDKDKGKDLQQQHQQQREHGDSETNPPLKKSRSDALISNTSCSSMPPPGPAVAAAAPQNNHHQHHHQHHHEDKCILCSGSGQGLTKTCSACSAVMHSLCLRKRGSVANCPSCSAPL